MVIMAIGTGLQCSELFALRWLDFDWNQLTMLVRRAIVDGKVGEVKNQVFALGPAVGRGAGRGPAVLF
jgi:integrase